MALGSVCGVAAVPGSSSAEARAGLILRICASLVLQKVVFSIMNHELWEACPHACAPSRPWRLIALSCTRASRTGGVA
eukprot:3796411-Prymnesium_polylepis.1